MNDFHHRTTAEPLRILPKALYRSNRFHWLATGIAICLCIGCTKDNASRHQLIEHSESFGDERLDYVVNNLQRLGEFDDEAMQKQIVSQLNAWVRGKKPPQGWEPDPMIKTLPESLQTEPLLAELAKMEFRPYDGMALYEATTLRDVADWAAGDQVDPVAQAKHLFDWTVRNIQLEPDQKDGARPAGSGDFQTPWETLLFGKGTAQDRAWVFMLLLRQRSIDSVLLTLQDVQKKQHTPWAVAVLVKGKLYLFDPRIGLPIPAENGIRTDPKTGLSIHPATLDEVARKPELLRSLDLDKNIPYPVNAKSLKDITALLEASPTYLSARMDFLGSQLVGDDRMVLTAIPSALAEQLKKHPEIKSVALWEHPYRVVAAVANPTEPMRRSWAVAMRPFRLERRIERSIDRQTGAQAVSQAQAPFMRYVGEEKESEGERRIAVTAPLWKARLLYLKGNFLGENGATRYFQMARPSNKALSGIAAAAAADDSDNVSGATLKATWEKAKQDASYWLGVMSFERAKYGPAIDYFVKRVLDPPKADLESDTKSPWTSGATYNLGRTFEAEGRFTEAIGTYRKNEKCPNRWQSELRARLLESSEQPRQ